MIVNVRGNSIIVQVLSSWRQRTCLSVLQEDLSLPESYARQRLHEKAVLVDGRPVEPDTMIGHHRRLQLNGDVEDAYGVAIEADDVTSLDGRQFVLWEDEHALVVNKPAGRIIHPSDLGERGTLDQLVGAYFELSGQHHRVRHVHRLDRDTTGCVLYAKHGYSARALDQQLSKKLIQREYLAVVTGTLPTQTGTINQPIGRDRHVRGKYRVSPSGNSARTHYRVLQTTSVQGVAVSLVACTLETGRTHQIRVHLSWLGCPLLGDELYGGVQQLGDKQIHVASALHAFILSFIHPYEGTQVQVEAPLPQSWHDLLKMCGWDKNVFTSPSL